MAVNHRPAEIKMADEVPYTELTSSGFSSSNTTRFMDIGIKMLVTPHVFEDIGGRYVQMELKPEVSFTTGSNNGIPVRAVRSTNSVANVRDGQTLVIGGITLTDSRHGKQDFPVLGKVPLLGMLFRHRDSSRTKNELMVFVTPTVYDKPESVTWDRMINLSDAVTGGKPLAPASKAQPEERRE
jgi:type II secretory pathway component GspD/PulD (secretin)